MLGLASLIGLSAWLFTRVGLLRLQSQLAAEIRYEDQRARAGDVAAVLALQAPDETAWHDQVAAEVQLGLAAPLPAGNLLPAGTPARVERVDPLGGDLFSAVVTRDYVDSAGQTFAFDLNQRYRSVAPGQWERLPPDTVPLSATTVFQGQRLSASVPSADLPWLQSALLQADELMIQTCADWGGICPAGRRLSVTFGAPLDRPVRTVRDTSAAGSNYPRIFDLATPVVDASSPSVLVTPALAGRPHDAAAQAALSRSISVQLLSLYAGELSGSPRGGDDYFLDALVARAEVRRLGASAAPQPLTPLNDVRPETLWGAAGLYQIPAGWRTDLAARREAFDFLNFALAGAHLMPVGAWPDGKLLLNLRRGVRLNDWLGLGLGTPTASPIDAWTQLTEAALASHPVADWNQYTGLVMACDDALYQVQAGSPKLIWWNNPASGLRYEFGPVSPDGRYMTISDAGTVAADPDVSNSSPSSWMTLLELDLRTGNYRLVFDAPVVDAIGWSSNNELIYTVNNSRLNQEPPAEAVPLWAYNPVTGYGRRLIPDLVLPYSLGPRAWSADHTTLLLDVADQPPQIPFKVSTALLTFGPQPGLRRIALPGRPLSLSPDGRRIALLPFGGPDGANEGNSSGVLRLNLFDSATGHVTPISIHNPLLPSGFIGLADPIWSADGAQLAWHTYPTNQGDALLSTPAAGGPVRVWANDPGRQMFPVGFSPDGGYLAALVPGDLPSLGQYWLFAENAAGVQPPLTGSAQSILWMPTGHRLVAAGPAGVSALDPATGEYEWLGPWQNCQLRW